MFLFIIFLHANLHRVKNKIAERSVPKMKKEGTEWLVQSDYTDRLSYLLTSFVVLFYLKKNKSFFIEMV